MDLGWSSEVSQSIASGVTHTHTHTLIKSPLAISLPPSRECIWVEIKDRNTTLISWNHNINKKRELFGWKIFLFFLRCSSCFIARSLICQAHWDLFCQDESQTPSGELVKANWPSLMKMFCQDVIATPIAQPQDVRVVVNMYYSGSTMCIPRVPYA